MITRKELGFVSMWPNRIPYPGIEYATEAAEKLKDTLDYYNKYYNNKQYEIILSNGEELSFEILNKNLCHLLGIDYKNLIGDYYEDYRSNVLKLDKIPKSYDLLISIIDNIDDVLKYDCDNNNRAINYYRIMVKCSIFEKISDFGRFNFGVINFDKDTFEKNSNYGISINSTKLLYGESGEASVPYFMMGILQDNQINNGDNMSDKYVAETLIAPPNVGDFFKAQEVSIPTQILISTDEKMEKLLATPSEKIALLNQYRSIIKNNNLPNCINIYSDYENILLEQSNVKRRVK